MSEVAATNAAVLAAWRRFRPMVRRTLMRILGPDDELRDLSQEAFLQLYRSLGSLRSPEAMGSFVAGIAVRLALHEIRRRRVRGAQVLLPGQGPIPLEHTSHDPEAREAMERLREMLERLPAVDRDIFVLRQIDGLDQADIGAAIHLSVSTVRRRLRRLERRMDILLRADPALAGYVERGQRERSRAREA